MRHTAWKHVLRQIFGIFFPQRTNSKAKRAWILPYGLWSMSVLQERWQQLDHFLRLHKRLPCRHPKRYNDRQSIQRNPGEVLDKTMVNPNKYLGWSVTCATDGSLTLNEPYQIYFLFVEAGISSCNPVRAPFSATAKCYPPNEDYLWCASLLEQYQSFVGHVRYVLDSKRPYLAHASSFLGLSLKKTDWKA